MFNMQERHDNEAPRTLQPMVDGHTHIDQYDPSELADLLSRAHEAGVGLIIAAGTTVASCNSILEIADQHPMVHAGVGLHPADLTGRVDAATEAELRRIAAHPKVVEWSETGLDYMPNSPPLDVQQEAFRIQIRLAKEFGLPLVTHSREADEDTVRILREEGASEVGGAWHYFGGSEALAEQAMALGFYISLAKPLLRIEELQQVAAKLPLERIVIETDSFPQPFKKYRERWTEPWHLRQVAEKLAELQGTDVETVARVTTGNYLRMLKGRVEPASLPLPVA
jgi:TatD DNase family protein